MPVGAGGRQWTAVALRADEAEARVERDMALLHSRRKAEGHEIVTASLQDLFGKPEWPPAYPHVPGVPCKYCGWDGKHAD